MKKIIIVSILSILLSSCLTVSEKLGEKATQIDSVMRKNGLDNINKDLGVIPTENFIKGNDLIMRMKILHILRTRPDVTVEKLMQGATNGDRPKVTALYELKDDQSWSKLVDEIFSNDKVISWW